MKKKQPQSMLYAEINIPASANVGYPPPPKPKKHWALEVLKEKPRTRWEWWREFLLGFVLGWMLVSWLWESHRKRRQVIIERIDPNFRGFFH